MELRLIPSLCLDSLGYFVQINMVINPQPSLWGIWRTKIRPTVSMGKTCCRGKMHQTTPIQTAAIPKAGFIAQLCQLTGHSSRQPILGSIPNNLVLVKLHITVIDAQQQTAQSCLGNHAGWLKIINHQAASFTAKLLGIFHHIQHIVGFIVKPLTMAFLQNKENMLWLVDFSPLSMTHKACQRISFTSKFRQYRLNIFLSCLIRLGHKFWSWMFPDYL